MENIEVDSLPQFKVGDIVKDGWGDEGIITDFWVVYLYGVKWKEHPCHRCELRKIRAEKHKTKFHSEAQVCPACKGKGIVPEQYDDSESEDSLIEMNKMAEARINLK